MTRGWPLAGALDTADDFEKLFDDGVIAYYRRKGLATSAPPVKSVAYATTRLTIHKILADT